MYTTSISNAKANLNNIISSCIKFNCPVTICSKKGNVVLLSENDYENLKESLSILSNKNVRTDIEMTSQIPTSEFAKELPWK